MPSLTLHTAEVDVGNLPEILYFVPDICFESFLSPRFQDVNTADNVKLLRYRPLSDFAADWAIGEGRHRIKGILAGITLEYSINNGPPSDSTRACIALLEPVSYLRTAIQTKYQGMLLSCLRHSGSSSTQIMSRALAIVRLYVGYHPFSWSSICSCLIQNSTAIQDSAKGEGLVKDQRYSKLITLVAQKDWV